MERRGGLVFIEEMVEENAVLEFYGTVCFKAGNKVGLKGVDRLFLFTRHG
jgi:hypothetical protein